MVCRRRGAIIGLVMLRIVVLFFALSGIAAAQSTVQIDFGVRGGLLANNSFQANQLCSGSGCAFGTRSFTAEKLHGTVGQPPVSCSTTAWKCDSKRCAGASAIRYNGI